MRTEKCIICLAQATIFTCHVIKDNETILAGWCKFDLHISEDYTKMNGAACFGEWKPEYGLIEDFPTKKNKIITLNVYGDIIKGKFISETENVITVEIISDSSSDSTPRDHETFHKGHITSEQ